MILRKRWSSKNVLKKDAYFPEIFSSAKFGKFLNCNLLKIHVIYPNKTLPLWQISYKQILEDVKEKAKKDTQQTIEILRALE